MPVEPTELRSPPPPPPPGGIIARFLQDLPGDLLIPFVLG